MLRLASSLWRHSYPCALGRRHGPVCILMPLRQSAGLHSCSMPRTWKTLAPQCSCRRSANLAQSSTRAVRQTQLLMGVTCQQARVSLHSSSALQSPGLNPRSRSLSARPQSLGRRAAALAEAESEILDLASGLPIAEVLPEVLQALDESGALVLQAPPGAGKTTMVPLALLLQAPGWLMPDQRILVLEPRRVAAKAAARRMAALLGEPVGQRVGFRVRLESRVSRETRVEVVTTGVLLRRLQQDPELEGFAAVLFDEFHERSVDSDLALALCLDARQLARPDLRLAVMSATLGGGLGPAVAQLLGGSDGEGGGEGAEGRAAPLLVSEGRSYPVRTHYLGTPEPGRFAVERAATAAVQRALAEQAGDVLCFLPGAGEIRRTAEMLHAARVKAAVLPLHGNLPPDQQDRAIRPGPNDGRRVVLATPIAESSLTISRVRAVVDSGLARAPRFEPRTGMDRLQLGTISKANAEQRRGRAGREAPGMCFRLWDSRDELEAAPVPEILSVDLTPLALQLAAWGDPLGTHLRWLSRPPADRLEGARALLKELGAVDAAGRLTERGGQMAGLGVHPRLAHMVLRGRDVGAPALACLIAALLTEPDPLRGRTHGADLGLRLAALAGSGSARGDLSRGAAHRIIATAQQLLGQVRSSAESDSESGSELNMAGSDAEDDDDEDDAAASLDDDSFDDVISGSTSRGASRKELLEAAANGSSRLVGVLVAAAYPDRIAKQRDNSNKRAGFVLANGRGARLASETDSLASEAFLAVAEAGGEARGANDFIWLAAPLTLQALRDHLPELVRDEEIAVWASASKGVVGKRLKMAGGLVLSEKQTYLSDEVAIPVLLQGLRQGGLAAVLPKPAEAWRLRAHWLARNPQFNPPNVAPLPDFSETALLASLEEWLAPHLSCVRTKTQLHRKDLVAMLRQRLDWKQQRWLEEGAPVNWHLPTGSKTAIDYSSDIPTVSGQLQEFFGLIDTPRIAGGKVPLRLELLSPARRVTAVTSDLVGFWQSGYQEVKRDLKGRYPKHSWPDDPRVALATRSVRKK